MATKATSIRQTHTLNDVQVELSEMLNGLKTGTLDQREARLRLSTIAQITGNYRLQLQALKFLGIKPADIKFLQ